MRDTAPSCVARLLATGLLALVVAGCDLGLPAGRAPHREGNRLDMIDQPKLTPQRADIFGGRPNGGMEPPAGAVAADETPYPYTQAQAAAAGAGAGEPPAGNARRHRARQVRVGERLHHVSRATWRGRRAPDAALPQAAEPDDTESA